MFCPKCGTKALDDALFCQKCGAKLIAAPQLQSTPSVSKSSQVTDWSKAERMSDISGNQALSANDVPDQEKIYGDDIKPYYRKQFEKIAAGQKPDFNWAACFLQGWNQLYNGCTSLFCKTFLPCLIVLNVSSLIGVLGFAQFNFTLMIAAVVLGVLASIASLIMCIVNGAKFNTWYYRDVTSHPGKKRSKNGLWILLACEVAFIVISGVMRQMVVMSLFEELQNDGITDLTPTDPEDSYVMNIPDQSPAVQNPTMKDATYMDVQYKNVPLINLLGSSGDAIYSEFGLPIYGTPVTGELLYGGTEYFGYDDISFELWEDRISSVGTASNQAEVYGTTLDKKREEIIEIFGVPSYEEESHDDSGDFRDCYYMQYVDGGNAIVLRIEFPDSNSIADFVQLYHYIDGPGGEVTEPDELPITPSTAPDIQMELSYNGTPLKDVLGCAPVQLYNLFGAPTYGTPVDGDMYTGGEYYGYAGIMFHIDFETSNVLWITGATEAVQFNGTTLHKTRAELIELLGFPENEGDVYDELEDSEYYVMQYVIGGTKIILEMADISSAAESFIMSFAGE